MPKQHLTRRGYSLCGRIMMIGNRSYFTVNSEDQELEENRDKICGLCYRAIKKERRKKNKGAPADIAPGKREGNGEGPAPLLITTAKQEQKNKGESA